MSEVITPVEDLFAVPEFGLQLTEWQRARMQSVDAEGRLTEELANQFQDSGKTESEVDYEVSYYLEMNDESFEELRYVVSESVTELRRQRSIARTSEHEAKQRLLEVSTVLGADQFALHGLWLHTRHYEPPTASQLKEKVQSAVADFTTIDHLVRDNEGNILTVVESFAQAGRLGEGGITIVNHNLVTIPQYPGSRIYSAAPFHRDIPEIGVEADRHFSVPAHAIHSILDDKRPRVLNDWSEMLETENLRRAGDGAMFIVGEVVEGPPHIFPDRDYDFQQMAFGRIRAIGVAAASGSIQTN